MSIKKNRELMVEQIKRLRGELNEVGKSELYKVGETIKLKKGIGYWDVTQYPYGGDFQRLSKETIATVVDGMVKYPNREVRATITVNGKTRTIVVSSIGIKESVNEAETKDISKDLIKKIQVVIKKGLGTKNLPSVHHVGADNDDIYFAYGDGIAVRVINNGESNTKYVFGEPFEDEYTVAIESKDKQDYKGYGDERHNRGEAALLKAIYNMVRKEKNYMLNYVNESN